MEAQAASACRAERESWDYESGKDATHSPRLPPTGRGLVLQLLSWTSTTASLNYSMLQLLWVHVRTNYVSNEAENAKGVGTHWRANAHAERTQKQTTECTGRDFFFVVVFCQMQQKRNDYGFLINNNKKNNMIVRYWISRSANSQKEALLRRTNISVHRNMKCGLMCRLQACWPNGRCTNCERTGLVDQQRRAEREQERETLGRAVGTLTLSRWHNGSSRADDEMGRGGCIAQWWQFDAFKLIPYDWIYKVH